MLTGNIWDFVFFGFFFFSSRRRHTRWTGDWSSDVCSSDLAFGQNTLLDGSFVKVFQIGANAGQYLTVSLGASLNASALGVSNLGLATVGSASRSEERRVGERGGVGGGRTMVHDEWAYWVVA